MKRTTFTIWRQTPHLLGPLGTEPWAKVQARLFARGAHAHFYHVIKSRQPRQTSLAGSQQPTPQNTTPTMAKKATPAPAKKAAVKAAAPAKKAAASKAPPYAKKGGMMK
jgi:hypothetical protein